MARPDGAPQIIRPLRRIGRRTTALQSAPIRPPSLSPQGAHLIAIRPRVLLPVFLLSIGAATVASAQNVAATGTLRLQTDAPVRNTAVVEPFIVGGWALDSAAASGIGIDAIHVWAVPPAGAAVFLGVASLGGNRPGAAASFGPQV